MVDVTEKVFQFIKRFKLFIIIFWVVAAISCAFFALDLPNQTVFQFLPPAGSQSDKAYNEMNKYFPEFLFIDTEVILIEAKWKVDENHTIINPDTQKIAKFINDSIWNDVNPKYNLLIDLQSYYSMSNITTKQITIDGKNYSIQSYIDMAIEEKYVDSTQSIMTIYVQSNINGASTADLNGYIDAIKSKLSAVNKIYPDYYIVLTGGITIFQQSMKTIQDDITSKDIVIMPIIFAFMIYMIGSWKLVALPGAALGMTIVIGFGIYYPFAVYWIQVNPMAPSIMMFLSMALSIDYSMFLLSRFAEERNKGKSVDDSVREMLRYSAHVVCLSGSILIICYMSIVIFPISGMETIGYAAAIAIFLCILINITLTTSSILQFPNFYGKLETYPSCLFRCFANNLACCCCCCDVNKYKTYGLSKSSIERDEKLLTINEAEQYEHLDVNESKSKASASMLGAAVHGKASSDLNIDHEKAITSQPISENLNEGDKEKKARKNCYFKLSQYTTRWPYKCIIPFLVYALMVPVIYQLKDYNPSIDFTMNFPRDVSSVNAYNTMIEGFNPGDTAQMYILVVSKQDDIWNSQYFASLCAIGNKLVETGYENVTQMISIGFLPNPTDGTLQCMTDQDYIDDYKTLINDPYSIIGNYSNSPYFEAYMSWFNQTVNNPEQTVSLILAIPNFNPYTGSALENCENYRDAINEVKNDPKYKEYVDIYLHQSLYWEIDSLHETDKTLPIGLAIIIIAVFILIGFVFKSVFLPLRLMLCIIVPILFVYGAVTGTYQNGWFEWTTWSTFDKTNGIYWMLPVITCAVLVGLAMDYEIFLYSRVFEYRSKGYTTSASIILGVSTTGPIISAAGAVMSMAFCGLLLETITVSNQMGLVFVFGVLVDTFIVRPMVVPAVLSFADKWNWYPTKMPTPTRDEFGTWIDAKVQDSP